MAVTHRPCHLRRAPCGCPATPRSTVRPVFPTARPSGFPDGTSAPAFGGPEVVSGPLGRVLRPAERCLPFPPGQRRGRLGRRCPARRHDRLISAAGSSTTAATAATATAAARRGGLGERGLPTPAGHGDSGQQLDGVVVALRAGRRLTCLTHRAADLEGGATGTAPKLITRHPASVGPLRHGAHREFPRSCPQALSSLPDGGFRRVGSTRDGGTEQLSRATGSAVGGAASRWAAGQFRRGPERSRGGRFGADRYGSGHPGSGRARVVRRRVI